MSRHRIFRRNDNPDPAASTARQQPAPASPPTRGAAGTRGRATRSGALFLLGMDNIGALENLFGEVLGDEVGTEVKRRISPLLPEGSRLWQAEHRRLALAVPGLDSEGACALFAQLQTKVAQRAIDTGEGPVAVTIAAGCVAGADPFAEGVMAKARHALADAMGRGAGCIRFSDSSDPSVHSRSEAVAAARIAMGAIDSGDLVIAFQPVVSAASTGRIAFHECLVRVRETSGELVTAAAFMPAMEQLGLATIIDRRVLVLALEALSRHPGIRVSINMVPQTMQDAQWMMLFSEGTRHDSSLAERLIIEVTESAAMLDPARTRDFMERLRRVGCAFALDDFGMGHTSFRSLRDFRFDVIKIDGSLITDITTNADSRFYVSKLVEIGRHFDMMTVAEFVQGPAEARILRNLGVEYFQGFYFGTPCLLLDPAIRPEARVISAS